MKKKYVFGLVIIGILLLGTLFLGTGYSLWKNKQNEEIRYVTDLECFKVYYSEQGDITLKNVTPVLENEGKKTSPYTITVTNICDTTKTLDIRLNVLNDSTIKTDSLSVNATGNIDINSSYYLDLKTTKSIQDDVLQSKLLGELTMAPNETIRTNIKVWFSELRNPLIDRTDYMKFRFELLDANDAILPTLRENVLDLNKVVDKTPNYEEPSTTAELINVNNNYYFRGNVENNYVSFANHTWRIVSVNENKTIKLVLNDTLDPIPYSNAFNASDYTGIKYIYNNEAVDNNINSFLLNWYQENLSNYDKYIAKNSFCNDSSKETKNGQTYFGAYNRLKTAKKPTLTCPETTYDFGGIYEQKIGLLTADEVAIAGAVYDQENTNYYLYSGKTFHTMSPAQFIYGYLAYTMFVDENGALEYAQTTKEQGVRPVIVLKEQVKSEGTGTKDDPFRIQLD